MRKLLVANRSEIAIRCFRAATELGLDTVAVYSHEDRFSLHRYKADEAFRIGPAQGGEPVRSYLDGDAVLEVALQQRADGIHPGYGFLSENASFARRCREQHVTFVGPTPEQLDIFGDKTASKQLARRVGVATVPGSTRAVTSLAAARAAATKVGYPIMVKASFGGGGRGMRVVERPTDLPERLREAQREAEAAFGRGDVFIERHVARAKHIEVQVLGDRHGTLVHLWERDCSVQRRHQKVVEVAPSIGLPETLRRTICDAAVALTEAVDYESAGTVEFLVDLDRNEFYFLEVNPRIQVEHTVTEMVTGIDLVRSQLLIAQGERLHGSRLRVPPQQDIAPRGVALQCRITTEDPENGFVPDYGRISTYRSPGGFAVRLDAGNGFANSLITPYFDSLLVKMTTWGDDLGEAVGRADRSLREFRIRGVKTNIPFLENLIRHPTFVAGKATTRFVDETPALLRLRQPRDRASKILAYLGTVVVNGRSDVGLPRDRAPLRIPAAPEAHGAEPPPGTRQRLQKLGPEAFAAWVRRQRRLLVTDTTMRDAHQSLLATRVRTYDLLATADAVARRLPDLFSLEMWGGATFDTSMRFLQEDPWERLARLRERIPNILFQMLLRGSNAVGYTSYPDNLVQRFVERSAANGIDLFRVFDALNLPANMKVAIDTVCSRTDALCEAAICYTGDIVDPARTKYSLDYYVGLAKSLVAMGAHLLAIKDMAGLCHPYAAAILVKALRNEVGVPIHFHTHDTSGIAAASVLRAADAGVDAVDLALASMSGTTSQPCLNSIAAALRHTRRDTRLDQDALDDLSAYWADVRALYRPFDNAPQTPTADVYRHEMPGGQFTNLRQQAAQVGLGDKWPEVCEAYRAANALCGDIVKVTPTSKVVGDLALFMVAHGLTSDDILERRTPVSFPSSVVEMMRGQLGTPAGGWPRRFRKIVLDAAGVSPLRGRPGATLPPIDLAKATRDLEATLGRAPSDDETLSSLLYPEVFRTLAEHRRQYDDTSVIPTRPFFYGLEPQEEIAVEIERGKTLVIRYLTVGAARRDGTRTVFFELNGQPRQVRVVDRSVEATAPRQRKAEPDHPDHVAAPMPGKIGTVAVQVGERVSAGAPLMWIEAMKMESAITAPRDGTIAEVVVTAGASVEKDDLLVVLEGG